MSRISRRYINALKLCPNGDRTGFSKKKTAINNLKYTPEAEKTIKYQKKHDGYDPTSVIMRKRPMAKEDGSRFTIFFTTKIDTMNNQEDEVGYHIEVEIISKVISTKMSAEGNTCLKRSNFALLKYNGKRYTTVTKFIDSFCYKSQKIREAALNADTEEYKGKF